VRDLSDVSLKPSDFATLAELCRQDRGFPADLDGWLTMIGRVNNDAHQRALYLEPLLLDVKDFGSWCVRLDIAPGLDALRAYVIIKRRGVS